MTDWTASELDRIGAAYELTVAPLGADGTLLAPRPIWVVRDGDALYVRSFRGPAGAWYQVASSSRSGYIRTGGVDKGVIFTPETDPAVNAWMDAAYRAKYGCYGGTYVDPLVGDDAHRTTLRLLPR
ncbi:DUF2255 family protein [Streptomyces sp. NPDC056983]|uniref:DUF2255 family protein n=1 Tax=Streptomyces sp. NPDC056983 TaxID=3345987 RepID=UPI0036342EC3